MIHWLHLIWGGSHEWSSQDIGNQDLFGASQLGASCGSGRAAARAYAIANALDGLSRADAARMAGMERQALRAAVLRYNSDGVDGLFDRPKGRRAEWLTGSEQETLAAAIFKGPKP